jgi:exodeoxyribonuclease-3
VKAVSWNVNSVRTRFERVLGFLDRHQPDLLCLQETKVVDDDFPRQALEEKGWLIQAHGQKTYNGVALISKTPLADVGSGFLGDHIPEQARVIHGTLDGVRFINVYVVNGKEVGSDKYEMKLEWLDALQQWIAKDFADDTPTVILGDFNIVPDDRDIWDPEGWHEKILCSTPERERLQNLLDLGFQDLHRLHTQEAGIYTWWDYRGGAFGRGFGMRIDLAL